ncbi:hypothetical protein RIVERRIDER_92 [Xanthomonas phage RiverRider]|uniref:Uncharacterized protein n=1 Tax=Xanthomonas phage RiverRider TaxID=2108116 RepID=A0A2P1JV30_9CAUD|nr:hypothetical protein HWB58_gp43 [Xanthomonas phage RiverRider]AVO23173.1 hypothetical protein RIVERRIDER_92 [Xanthomonas phage RiverRider]
MDKVIPIKKKPFGTDAPGALRNLADAIESGHYDAKHVVVVVELRDGSHLYRGYGEDFNGIHALGILEAGKISVIEANRE